MHPAISREFHFGSLLLFALPTVIMMIFMSMYSIVDGIFVSRFIGTDALSATNIVYPALNLVLAVAIMLSTGGSAVVARKLGEGDLKGARESFALVVVAGAAAGVAISVLGLAFLEPLCSMLGANGRLMADCKAYLGTLLLFVPASVLQILFQSFFVTAGRPGLGLGLTVAAGISNAALDYLLIVPAGMGITGAAAATAIGWCIPAFAGVAYFLFSKNLLRFARPKLDWRVLGESCFNGSSEMVTNISTGVTTFLFNILMLRYLGEDGVAAITIVLYAQFLLTALYLGFSMGVAPVVSFNYGSGNTRRLKRLFKICAVFIGGSSAVVFGISLLLAGPLVGVFSPPGTAVYEIGREGFLLFSLSFLFAGVNIFASAFFTALSNGRVSAAISFLRTFGFLIVALLLLPKAIGVAGIWLAVPFAELAAAGVAALFLRRNRAVYRYL
ncbi:MATE family efflux transporter [uncultured Anaerotruncus sp.]|mgnify:FL=1|uniref:MATE family efflux transporter n=1 Tax=uncultured Anaerotruncus sp. TaxID=905011 RepID=UPI00280AE928|nr:MATE family efflux transporter [uncultured Anaerotruncus sp.]